MGILVLQNIFITGLRHLSILILPLLSEDTQVRNNSHLAVLNLVMSVHFCLITQLFFVADVIVHRLLAASLGIYKLPTIFQDRPQLTSIADSMEYFLLNFVLGICITAAMIFYQHVPIFILMRFIEKI